MEERENGRGREGKRKREEADSPYLANLAPDPTRAVGGGGRVRGAGKEEAHPATCQFHLGPEAAKFEANYAERERERPSSIVLLSSN